VEYILVPAFSRDSYQVTYYNYPMPYQILFFGSFGEYSVSVLNALLKAKSYQLSAVITTPPSPKGRHLHLTPNEVQDYSKKNNIPVYTPDNLHSFTLQLSRPDFLVVAGYGKLIPQTWLDLPKIMAVNMHPSLLPDYAGRCPAEWAILNGETETGVTLIQMTEKFDSGPILAQEKLPISPNDTRLTLYTKLFDLGAKMLIDILPQIAAGLITPRPQILNSQFSIRNSRYARQITRQDGFISWEDFGNSLKIENLKLKIGRMHRAFCDWPGVWTINPEGKRLKLISLSPQVLVQPEGKSPIPWPL